MYGNDFVYARSRIEKTILTLAESGQPIYIESVDDTGSCWVKPLSPKINNARMAVNINAINFKPPRLGYCNTQGKATYISRIPMRRDWKQGLRRENMHSSAMNIMEVPYKDLEKCLSGEYPSMLDVYNHINKPNSTVSSMAFHRHWAMTSELLIMYKHNQVVGSYDKDKHQILLSPAFHHLSECLQESL